MGFGSLGLESIESIGKSLNLDIKGNVNTFRQNLQNCLCNPFDCDDQRRKNRSFYRPSTIHGDLQFEAIAEKIT